MSQKKKTLIKQGYILQIIDPWWSVIHILEVSAYSFDDAVYKHPDLQPLMYFFYVISDFGISVWFTSD